MGFPTSMFTVLFAVARTVGWISQWSEMIEDPQQKIGRPRQLYTGVARRDYVDDGEAEVSGVAWTTRKPDAIVASGFLRKVGLIRCSVRHHGRILR